MNDRRDERSYSEGKAAGDDLAGGDRWSEVRASAEDAVRRANALGGKPAGPLSGLTRRPAALLAVGLVGLAVFLFVAYMLFSPARSSPPQPVAGARPVTTAAATNQQQSPQPAPTGSESSAVSRVLGPQPQNPELSENLIGRIATIAFRLALAALLAAVFAFRPRRDLPLAQRDPLEIQVIILLSVLAAAMMLIAAGDPARALVILAGTMMVRFRPSIETLKQATVLLLSVGIGLACGAGRWETAILLAGLAFLTLLVLERYDAEQIGLTGEAVGQGASSPLESQRVKRNFR